MITYEITSKSFDYSVLTKEHLSTTFYAGLMAVTLAYYLIKDHFARAVMCFIVLALGVYITRIDWVAVPAIVLLASFIYYGLNANQKLFRGWMYCFALVACGVALFYPVPGIHNWHIVKDFVFSHQAVPYNMTFSLEKCLIGLFFIWFSTASLSNQGSWTSIFKPSIQGFLLAVLVLIPAAFFLQLVKLDFKPTNFYFIWALHNLFFVCIAEEAIFRGMIQNTLTLRLQNVSGGKYLAIVIASALFGLFHFQSGWQMMLLSGVAGLFYGWVFVRTKRIEASILVHFLVNSLHFLCFSYPALKSAMGLSPWDLFKAFQ